MMFFEMNRHGDSRHEFDTTNAQAIDDAMTKFAELTGPKRRMLAYVPGPNGKDGKVIRSLDRENLPESVVFSPQLIGG